MKINQLIATAFITFCTMAWLSTSLQAATAEQLDRDSQRALDHLYANHPKAAELAGKANAILVFPTIVKAGFIFGAQGGEGVLYRKGTPIGYYRTSSVSYGLQAGVQKYGYVMFFMNHAALAYLHKSNGWEVGVGPSIVIVDELRHNLANLMTCIM